MSPPAPDALRAELEAVLLAAPGRFAATVHALRDRPAPPPRDTLMVALLALREAMQGAGDEPREALVLDMLDWVVGWCSPGSRPFG